MILLFALMVLSCSKTNKNSELDSKRLDDIGELRKMRASPGIMVLVNAGKHLLFLDKTVDTLVDHIYDRAIVLASENQFEKVRVKNSLLNAQLYYFNDERTVVIQDYEGKIYLLNLDEEGTADRPGLIARKLRGGQDQVIDLKGYGLTIMKGRWDYNIMRMKNPNNAFAVLNYSYVGPQMHDHANKDMDYAEMEFRVPRCDSGGIGSESCSAKSSNPIGGVECSVKCKTGYYACCENSTTNCTCQKEPVVVN